MNPWIPIAVSTAATVIAALLGFIVKREISRQAAELAATQKAHDHEVLAREAAQTQLIADLKDLTTTCESRYLSREMFDRLESARKEVEQLRREQDTRLEELIKELLSKHGG